MCCCTIYRHHIYCRTIGQADFSKRAEIDRFSNFQQKKPAPSRDRFENILKSAIEAGLFFDRLVDLWRRQAIVAANQLTPYIANDDLLVKVSIDVDCNRISNKPNRTVTQGRIDSGWMP